MPEQFPIRRYLTNFDASRTGHVFTDVLVVGGGVAGLSAALEAARKSDVILITKGSEEISSTHWAQGGVAGAVGAEDTVANHVDDTLRVGGGLNRKETVEFVCREGAARIHELIEWGLPFDRAEGEVALGLEGGHHMPRVLHSGGDATGRALGRFLTERLRQTPNVRLFRDCFLIDLLTHEGACVGAVTFHAKYGHQIIWASRTVLASGGFGQLYRETTNPPGITGDGIAAALRAGARVADMELVQFHPTTLYIAGATRALISEAVRGEGAYLVNRAGERFMPQHHADAELAPRDVVSRAIVAELRKAGGTSVFLDVRHLGKAAFERRFPTITAKCAEFGIDVGSDLIPVRPAAHFSIGGVVTDLEARTSVEGLYCCGEASCTGLHGANRLASNSLLEGLVLGRVAGRNAAEGASSAVKPLRIRNENDRSPKTMLDLADVRQSLRSLLWRNAGIVRNGDRLDETVEIIRFWSRFVLDKTFDEPAGWEVQNMLTLGGLLAMSAGRRRSSCGVHYRSDSENETSNTSQYHYAYRMNGDSIIEEMLDLNLEEIR